ncbi:MAG TPA: hypothetical protein VNL69_07205 [Bacteroidota bacterium]|nr:hypothetical protein [Bacteroidota bacterium]
MHRLLAHTAFVLLALCYGTATFAEPIEALARLVLPGTAPQRITAARHTKPIGTPAYVIARRHLLPPKQVEVASRVTVSAVLVSEFVCMLVLPLPAAPSDTWQHVPPSCRCRPPPSNLTIT